ADRFQRRMRGRVRDYDESRSDYSDRQNRSERIDRVERDDRDERRAERGERQDRNDRNDRNVRLDRDARDARDAREEHELREPRREEPQEELVPVAGIVDVLESYAFVRTSGYLPGPNDVYVSMSQIKKYGLRKGDAVQGSIRAPREGDRRNQRQKFVPLQTIDSINGMSVEEAQSRPQFAKLTPLYPQERLKQETTPNRMLGRVIDLVAPIGKGQRGLIVSPPKAGKTITLQNIANAITTNNPEVHLMVVLVDERPEEVTDMERTVQGEVISSTFDRPATDHTTVAELAIERAKRLVELGQDVVVLLDSMTRLARAYNIAAPASGRILSGGVDAQALYPPKKFFGAARNIEDGGSLTIISSALVETGSKMDEVIFEEFKGTGNMELRLSRDLADKRLFPAVDINASGTRREELITPAADLPVIYRLRRLFGGLEAEQAYQTLIPRLKKTASNRDFLAAITQQTGTATNNSSSTTVA
ncbi:transcription termination factor Rho, partial [Bifidobacteriaceae bacterium NR015]